MSKVELCKNKVKLLGHMVGTQGISPDPSKIKAIKSANPPNTVKELRSFLGAMNFLGRYCDFQRIAAPLTDLLKKGNKWQWTDIETSSFNKIKDVASEHTLLVRFDPNLPLLLMSDASTDGCGALLFQMNDGKLCPIS